MGWKITFDGSRRELSPEETIDPFVSRWEGGKTVDLDELSPDVYDGIAASETGGTDSWWGVYRFPCSSGERMYTIAVAAAAYAGIAAPAKPSNMREAGVLLTRFERTEDIEEKSMVDGFPQTPPPENDSSSGPSDDTGGDLPKPDANE